MKTKPIELTDFERDVTISILKTALDAWDALDESEEERQEAVGRVVFKLKDADRK